MKILMLCDHYPISPRVKKVRNSLLKLYPNSVVKVFAWSRENNEAVENYVVSYNQDLKYGNKLKKLLNIINYTRNAKIFINKFKPDYIHAIDFEMLISSIFINNGAKIIYEVYDIKSFQNNILNRIREEIEFGLIKRYANSIIFASPFFKYYYEENGLRNINYITLNNKPSKTYDINISNEYMDIYAKKLKNMMVIGFIGTIRYEEILKNLIMASKKFDNIVIVIAGNGPSYKSINRFIVKNNLEDKVIMTGRYESKDLKNIYETCNYIWAAYPNKSLNVKYAISNKFFESIVFNKKVIVSENTMLGDYIKKTYNGFTVDPYNIEQISYLLETLSKDSTLTDSYIFEEGLYWEDEENRIFAVYGSSLCDKEQ